MDLDKEIRYFKEYRKKLIQFIIVNTCYSQTPGYYKGQGRVKFKPRQMLGLLKEISDLEKHISKLEFKTDLWN
jgi:hypothetical protein